MKKLHYLPDDSLNPQRVVCGRWFDEAEFTSNEQIMVLIGRHGPDHVCAVCLAKLKENEEG